MHLAHSNIAIARRSYNYTGLTSTRIFDRPRVLPSPINRSLQLLSPTISSRSVPSHLAHLQRHRPLRPLTSHPPLHTITHTQILILTPPLSQQAFSDLPSTSKHATTQTRTRNHMRTSPQIFPRNNGLHTSKSRLRYTLPPFPSPTPSPPGLAAKSTSSSHFASERASSQA